ncbi:FAD:protein FMN transferase [Enhygromyxa salina]|uniref:FAD:protein FMN transferase n=1 Tax=Enhygromyxa salina TaxID=215803 RepID=UPI0015E5F25C|nr:FAD:protein FMN transferase [Enhygromyxa salina]
MACSVVVVLLASAGACRREPAASDERAQAKPGPERATASEAASLVRKDGTIFAETELMGTHVSINLWVGTKGDALAASEAITDAMTEMARIEAIASEWRETSDLSRVNRQDGGQGVPVEVPPELVEILGRAAAISADTEGLFDVSFYSVGQLWRFEAGSKPPPAEAIAAQLPSVDWRAVELDAGAGTVALAKPGMKIGLGAIAKGYAVDRASALLHERGFANHIVEAGGDTQVSGKKGAESWRVGVQDPDETVGRVGHIVARDEAVVTSGNYARYFEWDGVHYTHILDPRTGWPIPVDRSPKSVTLIAQTATDADAYCTAVSVMTPEQGLAFVEARAQLEAVIIGPDGQLHVSSGLGERFVREDG